MVRVLANGDIVPDNDPRVRTANGRPDVNVSTPGRPRLVNPGNSFDFIVVILTCSYSNFYKTMSKYTNKCEVPCMCSIGMTLNCIHTA